MKRDFNRIWNKNLKLNWKFGLALLIVVCTVRFLLTLNANVHGNYMMISWIMIFSALTPFIFLSKQGRRNIGITIPANYTWLIYAFIIGITLATILYIVGYLLYADNIQNWYVYIGKSYNIPEGITGKDKLTYFIITAFTGMIFSPIGEELFFRGIVHTSFSKSVGDQKASIIDSTAFAITHLSHFGIVYIAGTWNYLVIPSLIWVLGMFISSIYFFRCRKNSGSIWGAVICHASFNLGMIFWIFYGLN